VDGDQAAGRHLKSWLADSPYRRAVPTLTANPRNSPRQSGASLPASSVAEADRAEDGEGQYAVPAAVIDEQERNDDYDRETVHGGLPS
jgi:hypothetical protein